MLKRFYRLKRQKGVVLFMVIAIMTLLIAMATTAYMTALSSYKTVVSNYDFSQMYLSAISTSDMLIEALTQETSHAGAKLNDYSILKAKVSGLESNKIPDPLPTGYVFPSVEGSTKSIAGYTDQTDLIEKSRSDPAVDGILDAVTFKVELVKQEPEKVGGVETGAKLNYFRLTTTAYYRGSSVAVQDMLYHKSGSKNKNLYTTFFTATGLSDDSGVPDTGRVVVVNSHHISDDTYFENPYTFIGVDGANRDNTFQGGLTTSGNLYMYKFTGGSIAAPEPEVIYEYDSDGNVVGGHIGWKERNDWFVGGDYVTRSANAQASLNGNNLYIKGDLVIASDGPTITADNVYVLGNIYNMGGGDTTINANLYVGGNIYNCNNPTIQAGASTDPGHMQECKTATGYDKLNVTYSSNGTAKLNVSGNHTEYSLEYDADGKPTGSIKTEPKANELHVSAASQLNDLFNGTKGADWDPSSTTNIENQIPSTSKTRADKNKVIISEENGNADAPAKFYVETGANENLSSMMSSKTGTNDYKPLSNAKPLSNELNIEFSIFNINSWEIKSSDEITNAGGAISTTTSDSVSSSVTTQTVGADGYIHVEKTKTTDKKFVPGHNANPPYDYTWIPDSYEPLATPIVETESYDVKVSGSNISLKKSDGTVLTRNGNTATFNSTDGSVATVEINGDNITVDIPYDANGYLLGLYDVPNKNGTLDYRFGTMPDEVDPVTLGILTEHTMNVMLKANFDDGTGGTKDMNNFNAFSWRNGKEGSSGHTTNVSLVDYNDKSASGTGNIIFEMGNYDPAADKYTTQSPSAMVPTYYEGQKLSVGTLNQTDYLSGGKWQNDNDIKTKFLQAGTPYPNSGYENHILFVSNKRNETAIYGNQINHTFCGYYYAPFGKYVSSGRGGGDTPIFGGMIVSVYESDLDYWIYCSPDPELMDKLFQNMGDNGGSGGTNEWALNEGKNYMG